MSKNSIFDKFSAQRQADPDGMHTDFIGVRTSMEFGCFSNPGLVEQMPPVDEDYLEWIDILESADYAKDRFVMVELGAGYGRWGVRGALAARQAGIKDIFIGFAEAEPVHVKWLKQHAANNGLRDDEFHLYEAAVSDKDGSVDFYVAMPDGSEGNNPAAWYGQAKAKDYEVVASQDVRGKHSAGQTHATQSAESELYEGHRVKTFATGWKAVEVRQMAANSVLRDFEVIDLLDMDVQGEEVKIVAGAVDELCARVKRLHIGTHSREIEYELYQILSKLGWKCLRAYPCGSLTKTPYGDVQFVDGMQTWLNPRLLPVDDFEVEQVNVPEKPEPAEGQEAASNASGQQGLLIGIKSRIKSLFGRKAA